MEKIEKDKNNLEKDKKIQQILMIIFYVLLILGFVYLAGYSIGKGWAYYIN